MPRSADYTIKGFLYQFNKTLLEILDSQDDSIINVEGIVEDIEIVTPDAITAIQCKYHEASKAFTPSGIYEPLLQMMRHFHENPGANIRYILFAHYPSAQEISQPEIDRIFFQSALESTNEKLKKYVAILHNNIDLDKFIARFAMEFGPSFDEIVTQVNATLTTNGIPESDVDTLGYPNAINMIAGISIKHDPKERRITKRQLLERLKSIRKTAISRWTMALRTRKQLLDARRKQIKTHLDMNSRLRYFVIDSRSLDDYDEEIVLFVSDYLNKYHFKPAHISTPVFCLCTTEENFLDVQYRLYQKGIVSESGFIADHFEESRFFREPFSRKGANGKIEHDFSLRLLRWEDHSTVLNNRKCDELFIIGEPNHNLNMADVNAEHLAAQSLKEVKYIIGVSNVYE